MENSENFLLAEGKFEYKGKSLSSIFLAILCGVVGICGIYLFKSVGFALAIFWVYIVVLIIFSSIESKRTMANTHLKIYQDRIIYSVGIKEICNIEIKDLKSMRYKGNKLILNDTDRYKRITIIYLENVTEIVKILTDLKNGVYVEPIKVKKEEIE